MIKDYLKLYLVADDNFAPDRDSLVRIVDKAVEGGVTMVQLRKKNCSTLDMLESARALHQLLGSAGIPLIVNDRLDIALACDADGVHIGQSDMPYTEARKILGYGKIIGLSIENAAQAAEANDWDVDYIGISPVFSTPTKKDTAPPLGLQGVRDISSICRHPSVGIGGINLENASSIIDAGACGVAVVSTIMGAPDPARQAAGLLSEVCRALELKNDSL